MPTLPPRNPERPDLVKMIRDLEREVRLLKERPREDYNPPQHRSEIVFSYHGSVLNDDPSGYYLLKDYEATIHRLDWTCRVTPTVDCLVNIYVDDAIAYQFVINAGDTADTLNDLAIDVEEWDRMHVMVTTDDPGVPIDGFRLSSTPGQDSGMETLVLTFQIVAVDGRQYA